MYKVFIDGKEGTTGLKIFERFEKRDDIELLLIDEAKRKDAEERKKMINASDITFLCLPDAAAREAVSLAENENVKIIDTSTAHRTLDSWSYGFPELSAEHRARIRNGKRIAVPGCHASGFIALVYPLTAAGIIPKDYPISAFSLTGYSGGGKKMIADYEALPKRDELYAPRQYALLQNHKHLPEMKKITGIDSEPIFCPIVDDYFCGMEVSVPLFTKNLSKKVSLDDVREILAKHYEGQPLISVNDKVPEGLLSASDFAGRDCMEISVAGNDERIVLISRFDNLGKGASGAAVQCMNIMLGEDETKGLNI